MTIRPTPSSHPPLNSSSGFAAQPSASPTAVASSAGSEPAGQPELSGQATTVDRPSSFRVVWQHRSLLSALVRRDIQNRYAGSAAGAIWALLHPLALLALYALVFESIFKVKLPQLAPDQPFVLFVALVLWPWMIFQEGVIRGTTAVVQHGALVKKVAFPHELLVYSAVLSTALVHGAGYALVLVTLSLMGLNIDWMGLGLLFVLLPALLLMTLALALFLSALQVFLRDVEQLLSQLLTVLMYATPILYPMSLVPDWLANVMQFNPLVHVLDPVRAALLGQAGPPWWTHGVLLLSTGIAFFAARWWFLRLSPYFEDRL